MVRGLDITSLQNNHPLSEKPQYKELYGRKKKHLQFLLVSTSISILYAAADSSFFRLLMYDKVFPVNF